MSPEETLRAYEQGPSDVEGTIRDQITSAYKNLEPELRDIRHYETAQLPQFYETFTGGYGMGTGAADLSPAQKMAVAGREVGRQATLGRTARDILDVRRAGLEDLVGRGIASYDRGYQGAQNQYNRWWQEQQAAEQRRQFDAQMAQQRANAARASRAQADAQRNYQAQQRAAALQALGNIPGIGAENGVTAQQRFQSMQNILGSFGGYGSLGGDLNQYLRNAGFSQGWIERNAPRGMDELSTWAYGR